MARLLLHIGPMKTGSTAIQAALGENRKALRRQGILALQPCNGSFLHGVVDNLLKQRPLSPVQEQKLARLRQDLAGTRAGDQTLLLSGELLGQGLDQQGIELLIELLRQACPQPIEEIQAVCYLRSQDELSVSLASTKLRGGRLSRPCQGKPFSYAAMLQAWAQVLGRQQVHPRRYDRSNWEAGDVVADFASFIGVTYELLRISGQQVRNPSLNLQAQGLLERLAMKMGERYGHQNREDLPGWSLLINCLDTHHSGPGLLPSRHQVEHFMASIQAENEAVAQEWFNDGQPLFSKDYSHYPLELLPAAEDVAVLDVAVDSLIALIQATPSH
jgi:hypothetical protein